MNQSKKQSLIGERFSLLSVQAKDEEGSTKNATKYFCLCDCGNITSVVAAKLNNGTTKSCGCLKRVRASLLNKSHGLRGSLTYTVWANMKSRCREGVDENYGERGITYDSEWSDFNKFLQDMGECPEGMSLDRIDVDGNYCKGNCRWESKSMQTHNRRKLTVKNNNTYSKYIGVSWSETSRKWVSKLVKNYEVVHREYFTLEYDAALAYDNISELYYGDRPNKTQGVDNGTDKERLN